MKRIILTTHVRQRMVERGIGLRHLRLAFANPVAQLPARHNCLKLISLVKGRSLTVIFEQTEPETGVEITAYWSD